jgi:4,5-DOPA dioxygenase extradiol
MVVGGWYVPNTPSLLVEADWHLPGWAPRGPTREALAEAGRQVRASGAAAVVVVSPHFVARGVFPAVVAPAPRQIYDFDGFPPPFYAVRYAPPGAAELGRRAVAQAQAAGLPAVAVDAEWGLDHGAWSPLVRMLPEADLPVLPLGLGLGRPDAEHELLGRVVALASGPEPVAVVATGSLLHRLDLWDGRERSPDPRLAQALEEAEAALASGDWNALWDLPEPTLRALMPEGGLRPLRVLAGAVGRRPRVELLSREVEFGAASLTVAHWQPEPAALAGS